MLWNQKFKLWKKQHFNTRKTVTELFPVPCWEVWFFAYRIVVCRVRCVYLEKTLLRSSACIEESTFQSRPRSEKQRSSFIKLCSWNPRNEPTALANVRGGWSRYWSIYRRHTPDDLSRYSCARTSADSAGWTGLKRPCIARLVQRRACNNVTNLLWANVVQQ